MNTVMRKLNMDITILQITENQIETDVFKRSGVDRILIPDVLMSRGMFLILIANKEWIYSSVWGNAHIFEHYINQGDPLHNLTGDEIMELGYNIMLHKSKDKIYLTDFEKNVFKIGDSVILSKPHQFLERGRKQIIDKHHS